MRPPTLGPQPSYPSGEPLEVRRVNPAAPALREIVRALKAYNIWGPIAVDDVLARYKRTILGPLWVILPQAFFIFGIYTLHKQNLGGTSPDFLPFLAISLPLWSLLSALVVETTSCFLSAKGFIESYALPPAIHVVRVVARSFLLFAHLLVVYFAVEIWAHKSLPFTMIAALPALAILAVFGIGAGLALAPLGTRFRDIPPALQALMMLGFVLTPVFWVPSEAQATSALVALNPLFYLIEVVRQPMLGSWGEPHIWTIAALIAFGMLAVGVGVYARLRSMILYWL